jgi:hypothetical protein
MIAEYDDNRYQQSMLFSLLILQVAASIDL